MSEHDQSANQQTPMDLTDVKAGHEARRPLNEGFDPRQKGDSKEETPKQGPVGRK